MAILLRKGNSKTYSSSTGVVSDGAKNIADMIDTDVCTQLKNVEKRMIKQGFLTSNGVKKDALKIWYEVGISLNKILKKYKINGTTDEPLFWKSIYGCVPPTIQKYPEPKRSSEWRRNHFRLCAKMPEHGWEKVKSTGKWSVWRDLFDNSVILEDKRVQEWLIKKIGNSKLGHKSLRPLINATRKRIKKLDTKVLSDSELETKLNEISILSN